MEALKELTIGRERTCCGLKKIEETADSRELLTAPAG
jgi:hypothetical protein